MKTILSRVKFNKKQMASMITFAIIASVAQMVAPMLISKMIDGVSGNNKTTIIILAVVMILLSVLACVTNIVSTNIAAKLTTRFSADLRKEIFYKVQSFSAVEVDKFGSASLITRNTTDVTMIQSFLVLLFRLGLLAPLMAVLGLVFGVASSGTLAVVIAIAIPILIVFIAVILITASRYSVKLRKKIDAINQRFLETLEGVRVIRAFNKQANEMKRFDEINEETTEVSRRSITISGLMTPVVTSLFGLTSVGAMLVGTYQVMQSSLDVSALVSATQYINIILIAITLLATVVSMFPDAYACMNRISEVLETEASIRDPEKKTPDKTCHGTVEFRSVTFSYPGADAPVFKDLSFVSKPGETTAIIGRTGCGKSSIVKLIPRLYDVSFGEVLVDGVNVKRYKLNELRDLVGYVPQKNVLFTGDIGENLNFGNEKGSEAEWKEAARIACADEFVEKKEGTYHAPVSQGGTNFSGGQRQRLAIARAIMKKAEIYIFDDSFSALDMKTDQQLRQNIKESMRDATVIVVAQRVSTIMDATRIIVLEDGEVVGMGTHRELLTSCRLYREIAEIQLGKEVVAHELESL